MSIKIISKPRYKKDIENVRRNNDYELTGWNEALQAWSCAAI